MRDKRCGSGQVWIAIISEELKETGCLLMVTVIKDDPSSLDASVLSCRSWAVCIQ